MGIILMSYTPSQWRQRRKLFHRFRKNWCVYWRSIKEIGRCPEPWYFRRLSPSDQRQLARPRYALMYLRPGTIGTTRNLFERIPLQQRSESVVRTSCANFYWSPEAQIKNKRRPFGGIKGRLFLHQSSRRDEQAKFDCIATFGIAKNTEHWRAWEKRLPEPFMPAGVLSLLEKEWRQRYASVNHSIRTKNHNLRNKKQDAR